MEVLVPSGCCASAHRGSVQPRRTATEKELPKNQQRRKVSKAGFKHALRATVRRMTPSPTSAADSVKCAPQVNCMNWVDCKIVIEQFAIIANLSTSRFPGRDLRVAYDGK